MRRFWKEIDTKREQVVTNMQKLRVMHSVEGTTFASQVGCKLANNNLTTHFVLCIEFLYYRFQTSLFVHHLLHRHSKRDIRGPSFPLHPSSSPLPVRWVQLSLQGASFSTKCKPARLKPHQMPMTMFLYRITNLQISIFKILRNVSSTKMPNLGM